jgi:hypothetical protein
MDDERINLDDNVSFFDIVMLKLIYLRLRVHEKYTNNGRMK